MLCVCIGTINSWISLRWCAADIDPPRRTVKAFDFGALSGDTLDLVTRFARCLTGDGGNKRNTSGDEKRWLPTSPEPQTELTLTILVEPLATALDNCNAGY